MNQELSAPKELEGLEGSAVLEGSGAFPDSLELVDAESVLLIRWNDGTETRHRLDALRAACPCAMCQGHHPSQSLNLEATQFPGIRITDLAPVGRYAYHIVWSDGHDTGIYTLRMLHGGAAPGR